MCGLDACYSMRCLQAPCLSTSSPADVFVHALLEAPNVMSIMFALPPSAAALANAPVNENFSGVSGPTVVVNSGCVNVPHIALRKA